MAPFDALPFDDRSVDELDAAARASIAASFQRRAGSELRVGRCFGAMSPLLGAQCAPPAVMDRLREGADQEERHAELCLRLARRYGGGEVAMPDIGEVSVPAFGTGSDELECALLVAGMCCLNESVAIAWLGACLDAATTPLARAANRVHLQDEIEHARLGWAYLGSRAVSPSIRARVGDYLPAMLAANLPVLERADPDLPEGGFPAHGHLGTRASRAVVREAVGSVVLRGFDHVGIDTRSARSFFSQWAESGRAWSDAGA